MVNLFVFLSAVLLHFASISTESSLNLIGSNKGLPRDAVHESSTYKPRFLSQICDYSDSYDSIEADTEPKIVCVIASHLGPEDGRMNSDQPDRLALKLTQLSSLSSTRPRFGLSAVLFVVCPLEHVHLHTLDSLTAFFKSVFVLTHNKNDLITPKRLEQITSRYISSSGPVSNIVRYDAVHQSVNLIDIVNKALLGSVTLSQKNFDLSSSPRDQTKYRKRRETTGEQQEEKECEDLTGKVVFPLSFVILFLLILLLVNVFLFSYALAKGNPGESEDDGDEDEEEKLIKKEDKTVESKAPPSSGKSRLENIDEENKDNTTPLPERANKGKRFQDSPAPAPIYKTDSTDFWEIEADTGYNEL